MSTRQPPGCGGEGCAPSACRCLLAAIDSALGKGGISNPHQPFVGFEWVPGRENSYVPATVNETFSVDEPVPIDARVTLSQGRLRFPTTTKVFKWTDADVECGLQAGEVVATCVKPRK